MTLCRCCSVCATAPATHAIGAGSHCATSDARQVLAACCEKGSSRAFAALRCCRPCTALAVMLAMRPARGAFFCWEGLVCGGTVRVGCAANVACPHLQDKTHYTLGKLACSRCKVGRHNFMVMMWQTTLHL